MTPQQPNTFPRAGEALQVLTGRRLQTVKVTKTFPDAWQIIGKLQEAPSSDRDPRGSFLVAELQGDQWIFKHSLTPEQAGERELTKAERDRIQETKPKPV